MEVNPERHADPAAVRFEAAGAYAQVLAGLHTWMLDWAFEPGAAEAGADVLRRALDRVAGDDPGGAVQVWVRNPTGAHDAVAARLGLRPGRDLLELRVPLPLEVEAEPLDWRPFVVGSDEAAWLEVNNRAFAGHLEQGGWTMAELEAEEAAPWFDPAGFLVVDGEGGRMAGFCWTKLHADHDPPLGEIYVIATDPDVAGRGLGRRLAVAALDWLHRHRDTPVGMLFVDGDNERALRLYRGLGFRQHRVDRAYTNRPATDRPAETGAAG